MQRKVLGRGLDALIAGTSPKTSVAEPAEGVQQLPIADVAPNPHQPRLRFDDESIKELAASIKASGVLQPIVVRRGLALSGVGVIIGVGAAAAGTGALAALLYEVQPLDALTFATVPLLLVACAAIASWLPARRASLVDPTVTLRAE